MFKILCIIACLSGIFNAVLGFTGELPDFGAGFGWVVATVYFAEFLRKKDES